MKNLDPGFSYEVDKTNNEQWSKILELFSDANYYQTYPYGFHTWGKEKISQLVLKENNVVVAAAQAWVYTVPVLNAGFAHISWGPMWRLKNKPLNLTSLKNIIRALQKEYVIKRKLLLRIRFNELDTEENQQVVKAINNEDLKFNKSQHRYQTIILDLSPDLQEIRMGFRPKWRSGLNKSEKKGIEVSTGNQNEIFEPVVDIHNQMVERKRFTRYIQDGEKVKEIQNDLSDTLKLRTFIGRHEGTIEGGIAVAVIGDTGMPILGSMTNASIEKKLNMNYLLQWQVISWLKENGFKYYDLKGYDPDEYPGPSIFKSGISKNIVSFLGSYESCKSLLSLFVVRAGELVDISMVYLSVFTKKIQNLFRSKN
ncbi:MAG: GNAT family N-acetyltransferase [Calditrichae bacterium]|nr:GNAT family N-acetyltransferase [Calditrichota bacterium]MCB9059532.1 GNAT family N-acetyltransferase [Calditrichia bacterium]